MSNFWKIYWLTRLDSFGAFLSVILFLCSFGIIIYFIIRYVILDDYDYKNSSFKKYDFIPKYLIVICIIVGLFKVFTPTQNEAILIIAGSKTLDFAQKDSSLNKIPYQTTELITNYLDKQIKDTQKEAK